MTPPAGTEAPGLEQYVVINAKVAAQVLGFVWLGIGAIVLVAFYVTGRRPVLAGLDGATDPAATEPPAVVDPANPGASAAAEETR